MGVIKNIFTWWEGATFGTWLTTRMGGERVGTDEFGNVYFQTKKGKGTVRRWVIYKGSNDASRVPADWFNWLRNTELATPDQLPPRREWEKPWVPNQTGTAEAYRPQGALEQGGKRAAATGDYEAWSPN